MLGPNAQPGNVGVSRPDPGGRRLDGDPAFLQARAATLSDILGEATRLGNRGVSLFAPIPDDSGLSGIELLTLLAIARSSAPPTVPQVGRAVGHPRQVIQRAVRVLEDAGLVEALPNPGHKRAGLLVVTAKGQDASHRVGAQAMEIVKGVAEDLEIDTETLAVLLAALRKLRRRVDDHLVGRGLSADGAE